MWKNLKNSLKVEVGNTLWCLKTEGNYQVMYLGTATTRGLRSGSDCMHPNYRGTFFKRTYMKPLFFFFLLNVFGMRRAHYSSANEVSLRELWWNFCNDVVPFYLFLNFFFFLMLNLLAWGMGTNGNELGLDNLGDPILIYYKNGCGAKSWFIVALTSLRNERESCAYI